jgi:hypothetical protein
VVRLVGRDDVMDKLVYTATNPVKDGLVDRVDHWPRESRRSNRTASRHALLLVAGPVRLRKRLAWS